MVTHVSTVAFSGIEAVPVDVQAQIASGLPAFTVVGLPDKAVAESPRTGARPRWPPWGLPCRRSRITVNLAPADVLKEGSPFRPAHRPLPC